MDGVLQEYFTFRSHEPRPSFQCNSGVVVKAKGNKAKSRERGFFLSLFMVKRGCFSLPSSFNCSLRAAHIACVLCTLASFSVDKTLLLPCCQSSSPSVLRQHLVITCVEKRQAHVAKRERTTGDESSPAWDEQSQQRMIDVLSLHWDT